MGKLTSRQAGLRVQDIQTGLQKYAVGELDSTRLVGMAERLAIHIRGKEVIDDEGALRHLGRRIGIDPLLLPRVLSVLQEVGFVEERSPGVYWENVPYFSDIYETMGDYWYSCKPEDIELASAGILEELSLAPTPLASLQEKHGLDEAGFTLVTDLGRSGGYISTYTAGDGEMIGYSPLFWEENPEALYDLLTKYPADDIAAAIRSVREHQGYPIADLNQRDPSRRDQILVGAMVRGVLPTPAVDSFKGKQHFAFAPYSGGVTITLEERSILRKARALLACIRYGEYFGTITRVRDPAAILWALEHHKTIGPHTEIRRQYALLAVEGLGFPVRDTRFSDRWHFRLIDREDNLKAVSVARDMLTVGEALTDRGLDEQARKLLFYPGLFEEPLTTIAERRQQPLYSETTIVAMFDRFLDSVREM